MSVGVVMAAALVATIVAGINEPRVIVARREVAVVTLRLPSAMAGVRAFEASVPLPVPVDHARRHLGDEYPGIRLVAATDTLEAHVEPGDALSSMMYDRTCSVDATLIATCVDRVVPWTCGNRPFDAPLASVDPERFSRWHYAGSGPGWLSPRHSSDRLDTPYGPDAAMAVDEEVLLVGDDASGHLFAHHLPRRWAGSLGAGVDLGPTRMRGELGRCDLGDVRTLYATSGEVLVGHGTRWSHFETRRDEDSVPGVWSCTPEALRRVDHDPAAHELVVIVCRASGCEESRVALPPELAEAPTIDAAHLGTSIAMLVTDASGALRVARYDASGFSSPRLTMGHRPARRGRTTPLLVYRGRLFASVQTLGGPAVLVFDASGDARWVRSADTSVAGFTATDVLPPDEVVDLVESRLDARFRVVHFDPLTHDGRGCTNEGSGASSPSFSCSLDARSPSAPMVEPGAVSLLAAHDALDGGPPLLVEPSGEADGRLDVRAPSARGFDATVYADGRTLAAIPTPRGPTVVIDQRDGAVTGCVTPLPPSEGSLSPGSRSMRFIPGQLLALSEDGGSVFAFDLPAALPWSERIHSGGDEACEHTIAGTPLATLAGEATHLSVCPIDGGLAWHAWSRDGDDAIPLGIGIGDASRWEVELLSSSISATVGCIGDALSVLAIDGERLTARRCTRSGCTEASVSIRGLRPNALALDLGDRLALLEVREDHALVARFGPLEGLASATVVEFVDARSAFVPLGTAAVAERPGVALVLGRTPHGIGLLRVGSDERATPVILRRPLGTFHVGPGEVSVRDPMSP